MLVLLSPGECLPTDINVPVMCRNNTLRRTFDWLSCSKVECERT